MPPPGMYISQAQRARASILRVLVSSCPAPMPSRAISVGLPPSHAATARSALRRDGYVWCPRRGWYLLTMDGAVAIARWERTGRAI